MLDFRGPKLKIERAKQHITDLHQRLKTFEASRFYDLLIEHDLRSDKNVVKVIQTKPIPDDFALIIGDAIHNLKSALDFAVNDVIFSHTGKRPKYLKFPIYKTEREFRDGIKGGSISRAPKAILDLLVNDIKPYYGGNDALYFLHELNILDKHMLLIPVVHFGVLTDLGLENDRGEKWTGLTLTLDTGIANIPQRGNLKITDHGQPSVFIFFDKGLPAENRAIIPMLGGFAERVSRIIESFETTLSI